MKKNFLSLIALVGTFASAQYVGVNTSSPQSTLDVTAKNPASSTESQIDGVLVARVSKARAEAMGTTVPNSNLIFVDDVTAPATIATTTKVSAKGFYYYDTAQSLWIPVSGDDWHITGNSGTTVGTNYLGTNDAQPLMFKTNNVQSGYLDYTNATGNTAFGYNALLNGPSYNTISATTNNNANTALGYNALAKLGTVTGDWQTSNVAVGNYAMANLVGGAWNTAIGTNAMGSATGDPTLKQSMRNNVALGISALANLNYGSFNLAIGPNAMSNAKVVGTPNDATNVLSGNMAIGLVPLDVIEHGTQNMAFGYFSGQQFKRGNNNIFLGAFAASSQTQGSNNILIGQQAQTFNTTGNGQINIGNVIFGTGSTNDASVNANKKIGINLSSAPNSTLQVGGSVAAKIRTLSSGTVADDDYTVLVQGNISLPNPDATNTGRIYYLISDTSSNTTITIPNYREGGTTTASASYGLNNGTGGKGLTIQSTGNAWVIISRY